MRTGERCKAVQPREEQKKAWIAEHKNCHLHEGQTCFMWLSRAALEPIVAVLFKKRPDFCFTEKNILRKKVTQKSAVQGSTESPVIEYFSGAD